MSVSINITKSDYVYVDPATGKELTKKEFTERYSAVPMGGHRVGIPTSAMGEVDEETETEKNVHLKCSICGCEIAIDNIYGICPPCFAEKTAQVTTEEKSE